MKYSWQLDPFGHSRTHAYLADKMGFSALVLGRIEADERHKRLSERTMNFVWNVSCDSSILT